MFFFVGQKHKHKVAKMVTKLSTFITSTSPISGAIGGGADKVFFENDQTVTTNYSISANKNALTAGPITVNNGITVTVPAGSAWTIV